MTFRRSLALLVAGSIVPVVAFAAILVYQYRNVQTDAARQAQLGAARALALAIDKHFEGAITALKLLGASQELDSGDLAAFYRECVRAIEVQPDWRSISLFDPSQRRLLITSQPYGTPLPGPPAAMSAPFKQLVETRTADVSDVFESPITGQSGISIGVPILRNGEVRWVLSAGVSPQGLAKLVASQRGVPDGTAVILDRRYRVVTRSDKPVVPGESLPEPLVAELRAAPDGAWRGEGPDGAAAITAFSRSPIFGWTAAVSAPAPSGLMRRPDFWILVAGAGVLAIGLGIAAVSARRITRPMEALARAAQEIGRGRTVQPVPSGVQEIAALSAALAEASHDRARAEADLARTSERLRILHQIDAGLIAASSPESIAEATLPRLRDLLGVPRVIVNLFDWEANEVEWMAAVGRRRVRSGPGVRYPMALAGDIEELRRGEPQRMNVRALPPSPETEALLASGIYSYVVVPMIAQGELIGSVSFGGATEVDGEQISIAREVADQMAIAIAQARLVERVHRHADELEQRVRERTAELEQAQASLLRKERLAVLGQLAGGVSHELRNPLGVISNSVYFLKMVAPDDERVRKHLGIVEREVQMATRIVGDLLDFARMSPAARVPTDLSAVLRETMDEIPVSPQVQVVRDLHPELPRVPADPQQLRLIVSNLVRNALQAMPDGGTLTISTAVEDGKVVAAVSDTGIGIPPEHLERIFEPLFTTRARGIGLGLAIAQMLAGANGAVISVTSTVGVGSRFTIAFPKPGDAGGDAGSATAPPPSF